MIAWHILRYTGNTWIPSCGPSKQYQCHLAHLHGLSKSRLILPYNIYKFLQVLFLHVCTFRLLPPPPWVLTQANACWMPSLSYVHKLKLLRNVWACLRTYQTNRRHRTVIEGLPLTGDMSLLVFHKGLLLVLSFFPFFWRTFPIMLGLQQAFPLMQMMLNVSGNCFIQLTWQLLFSLTSIC